jgi:glucokinase
MRDALPRLLEAGDSPLHERARNAPETLTPRDLSLASEAGDQVASAVLRLAGERLGVAIASAANLLDITTFVVGGGIANAGAPLFDGMRDAARERVLAVHRDTLRILPAEHGNDAGMLGAAALFLD